MRANLIFCATLISLLFFQCKKEAKEVVPSNIYSHILPGNDEGLYVYPLLDGSILVVSAGSDSTISGFFVSKYSETGKREWVKVINTKGAGRKINPLKDGSLLISLDYGENRLLKINDMGDIVFNTTIHDSIHDGYSHTIEGEDHHFYNMFFKVAVWMGDGNKILEYDENGKLLKGETIQINDNYFGGDINNQVIYKVSGNKTIYFCGLIYTGFSWLDNTHLFVSRFEYLNKKLVLAKRKTVILDPANVSDINLANEFHFLNTNDNKVVLMNPQELPGRNTKTHLTQVDENLNKVWELDINLGNGNTIARSIRNCPDGNYLIAGSCRVSGKGLEQPFVAKISSDGTIMWSKIYDMAHNARIVSGFQKNEGPVITIGNTTSFGGGRHFNDMFIMKTDKNGNLK